MLKYCNKFFQLFIDILILLITLFVFFSLYNLISIKVLHKNNNNIFGITIFEIISGSMEPTINVNDLIIVTETDSIKENDIITYKNNDDFITHRVIKIEGDVITTKGDSNNSVDNKIRKEDIIGKVIFTIPKGGIIRDILVTPKVLISIVLTLILFSLCASYIPKNRRIEFIDFEIPKKEPIEIIELEYPKDEIEILDI